MTVETKSRIATHALAQILRRPSREQRDTKYLQLPFTRNVLTSTVARLNAGLASTCAASPWEDIMENARYSGAFRIASHVILLLMAAAIVYASAMAIIYWTGIGV